LAFGRFALGFLVLAATMGVLLNASAAFAAKYAAIVVDARTGEVLHEEDADAITYPASLTKMMTLYMTFEAIDAGRLTLDQALPVSAFAQSMAPTKLGLRVGQTLRVEQAILALVTKSANDAAVVLAEALGGSEPQFAEIMTRKAREIGMRNTVFKNASGLPNMEQVTTARDFAVLSRVMLSEHSKYYQYFSRRSFVYGGRTLSNHNRLMSRYEGMDGIKTGYTNASGFNLAASAVRDGRRLVAVVLGGRSALARDNRMAALLDQAFGKGRDTEAPVVASVKTVPGVQLASIAAPVRSTPPTEKKGAVKQALKARADKPALAKATPVGAAVTKGWGVQVGAFGTRASGDKAIAQALKQAPGLLRGAKRNIVEAKTREGRVYRARLMGLDEQAARKACTELTRTGHRCITVAPSDKV
jgi:D-alanyl-D-alanine carboxypeptidase